MTDKTSTLTTTQAAAFVRERASLPAAEVPCFDHAGDESKGGEFSSQSVFVSKLQRLSRSISTWGFIDQAVVSVTSFIVAACIGRYCGKVELGIYSFAVKLFWLAAGIPNALVWMPYTSYAPRLRGFRRSYFLGSATSHVFAIALAICLVWLAIGLFPIQPGSERFWLGSMCLALIPFTAMMMYREHLRRVQLAHMSTSRLMIVDLPIAASQLVVLWLLIQSGRLSAVTALVGMSVGCCWAVIWTLWHREEFLVERQRVGLHWGFNWQFGKWLLIMSIAWNFGEASYYWFVEAFHGAEVLGQFSAAAITVLFFNPIMLTVQNLTRSILSNTYAQSKYDGLKEQAVSATKLIVLAFGLLFLLLASSGGWLVALFFGGEFTGLGLVVASLCLGLYLHVIGSPVESALAALQDGRAIVIASVVRLGLIMLLGVPLIAAYGPIGVGFAMALGALGAGAYQWYHFLLRSPHAV